MAEPADDQHSVGVEGGEEQSTLETSQTDESLNQSVSSVSASVRQLDLNDVGEHLKVEQAISPFLLENLERDARRLADSLSLLMGGLTSNLHAFSAVTRQYVDAHEVSVNSLVECTEQSLNEFSELVAKCDEILDNMKPVEVLCQQIESTKATLDALEYAFEHRHA